MDLSKTMKENVVRRIPRPNRFSRTFTRLVTTTVVAASALVASALPTNAFAAPVSTADAFKLLPENTQVVVYVPNLSKLSDKIAMLNQALELNIPGGNDLLGMIQQETKLTEGINREGALIVSFSGINEAITNHGEPTVAMLVPVSDYKALAAAIDVDENGAVSQFEHDPYIKKVNNNYAVISESEDTAANYQPGDFADEVFSHLGTMGTAYAKKNDIILMVNLPALSETLLEKIDEAKAMMMAELDNAPAGQGEMVKPIFEMYAAAATAIVRDSRSFTIGIDISEMGMGISKTMQFKDDSEMAGIFAEGNDSLKTLSRLPKKDYLMAMSTNLQGLGVQSLIETVLDAAPKGDDGMSKIMATAFESIKGLTNTKAMASGLYLPSENFVGGLPFQAVTIAETKDSKAYITEQKRLIQSMNGAELPLGPDGGGGPSLKYNTSFTEKALEVDGVAVHQYQVNVDMPQELMLQMGPAAGLVQMFTNQGGYLAAVGDDVIMTSARDAQLIRSVLKSMKQTNGLGTGRMMDQLRENMPHNAVSETYISVSGIFKLASPMMQMFGMPPVQIPTDLPPLAMRMSVEDQGVAGRLFIPMPTAKFVKNVVDTVQKQMQGPGKGGGAPGPAPF